MTSEKQPTYGNGKICYLEIPAINVEQSALFYAAVFGWKMRKRGDGATAFDDGVNEVSGAFVLGRKPMTEVGLLVYVMVDSVEETLKIALAHGAALVQSIGVDAPEITARIGDPAGNVVGLYQNPPQDH